MMKILIISLFIVVCFFKGYSQNDIEISLLTCSAGNELYSSFGHSAIRVVDYKNHEDIVFDYGVFDNTKPHFIWSFIKGDLNYKLTKDTYENFLLYYENENREVTEQKIDLSSSEKEQIYKLLLINHLPENRYYQYEFIRDNCSTRIRDLVNKVTNTSNNTITDKSFRNNLHLYLAERKWLKLGIDILLGQNVDREMTYDEQMFLPIMLSLNLPYTDTPTILLDYEFNSKKESLFIPSILFYLLLIVLIFLVLAKSKIGEKSSYFIYSLYAIIGFLLLFMWMFTSHTTVEWNWNLLWLNPLYVFMLFRKIRSNIIIIYTTISLNALIFMFWRIIPQEFNPNIIPLIGIIILLNLNQLLIKRKNIVDYKGLEG